jgi:hypothetical protein
MREGQFESPVTIYNPDRILFYNTYDEIVPLLTKRLWIKLRGCNDGKGFRRVIQVDKVDRGDRPGYIIVSLQIKPRPIYKTLGVKTVEWIVTDTITFNGIEYIQAFYNRKKKVWHRVRIREKDERTKNPQPLGRPVYRTR